MKVAGVVIQGVRRASFSMLGLLTLCYLLLVLAPSACAQSYAPLYEFQCVPNLSTTQGCFPKDIGQLTVWSDGSVYGTAYAGSAVYDEGCGTIFNLNSGVYTDVYSFDPFAVGSKQQCSPAAGLTPAFDPKTSQTYLYGTTSRGLAKTATLFRYDPSGGTMTILHNIAKPDDLQTPPTVGKDGNLYGLTNNGVPYQLNIQTNAFKEFSPDAPGGPNGPLYLASDGNFYAGTCSAVTNSLFSMTVAGVINPFYSFATADCPVGGLTQLTGTTSNLLFGVTRVGGSNGNGYVFKVAPDGSGFQDLHDFGPLSPTNTNADGANPLAGLLSATDGNLYGTTSFGGANGLGTLFELVPAGSSWSFVKLFDFTGTTGTVPGDETQSSLLEYPDGSFYGTTYYGGISDPPILSGGQGVVYRVTPFNPFSIVTLCCNNFVVLDQPVQIFGINLEEVESVTFAGAPAQFQQNSPTYLTAQVPAAAVDGQVIVTAINSAGEQEQVESFQTLHILPTITNFDPPRGAVGSQVNIAGGGFANTTQLAFDGIPAPNFSIEAPNLIVATVPAGAKTGKVTITTPNGSAASKKAFRVVSGQP